MNWRIKWKKGEIWTMVLTLVSSNQTLPPDFSETWIINELSGGTQSKSPSVECCGIEYHNTVP